MNEVIHCPAYLRDPQTDGHMYGTLSYNRRSKCWMIRGELCVTELAKRLFPGCDGRRRGEVRFAAHRRIIGDLNWLMLRYPLEVKESDTVRWEEALKEAREYAVRREENLRTPALLSPSSESFSGELMHFQQEGLSFLMTNRRCLLADEMGLGKTVQALSFIAMTGEYPVLLVVPPHLVRNWEKESNRFLLRPEGVRIHTIKGLTSYELPEADIYIIHYLLLRGWKKVLPDLHFRTVIYDEIQELRHAGTEKYSAASLLSDSAENVIGLSGTPIYNHGGEIWNVINILDFNFLGSWEAFTREWCYGYNTNLVARPQELGEFLRREGMMLRRTKDDVLTELPPKRRLVQEIDWDDKLYREMMLPVIDQLKQLRTTEDPARRAILEDSISQSERQATGIAKAPYVAAFVRALLEAGETVLLMAHHHAVMDAYRRSLKAYQPRFVTGRETQAAKERSVTDFLTGKTDLLCVSLRSASGLNLQRATCVVFGELDWSPAVHSQAEDRAHRIGQTDSVLIYYLVAPKGSDLEMQNALGLKISQFVSLMGDAPEDRDSVLAQQTEAREHIRALVARLKEESGIPDDT